MAPFQRLMNFDSNSSFLEILGFNKDSFRKLSRLIYAADELANKRVVGRPHTLSSCERLGLAIMFLSSNMKMKHLCMIFGDVPTVVQRSIRLTVLLLISILQIMNWLKLNFLTKINYNI
jgi:hypothetical protein